MDTHTRNLGLVSHPAMLIKTHFYHSIKRNPEKMCPITKNLWKLSFDKMLCWYDIFPLVVLEEPNIYTQIFFKVM